MKKPVDLDFAKRLMMDCQMQLPAEEVPWVASWPDCGSCSQFAQSNGGNPACPPGGTVDDFTYVCPICGRRWKQFIVHVHLWRHVTDYSEWQGLRREQYLKDAGIVF